MIYEGQAKRRMAKILEPRPCVCPKCMAQKELDSVWNQRIDNMKMTQGLTQIPKSKEAPNARR